MLNRLLMLAALAVLGCGDGQPATLLDADPCDAPSATAGAAECFTCNGARTARVSAGPDGWCDFDGTTCACHGHGAADQCDAAVAGFGACFGDVAAR